ncbi:MAG: YraN family protein [Actinomycetota bacterium]
MPSVRQVLGAWGEEAATRWYREQGYEIVARNWRAGRGELDLVAATSGVLVVCEVRTRRSTSHGSAFDAVTHDKQRRVRRLAMAFLDAHPTHRGRRLRFDVAAVSRDGSVDVLESAF